MTMAKRTAKCAVAVLMLATALAGCSSIRNNRGYLADPLLAGSVQPGIDNRQSVERTLGRPTFISQFGEPVWYYVSSVTGQAPFTTPKIRTHAVMAIHFDEAGNVAEVERTGIEKVVFLDPEGDKTPTLGRERGFLEDLFGNIGQVGAGAPPGGG